MSVAALVASVLVWLVPAHASARQGVYGAVTRGPTRPVCIAGKPCGGPAAGVRIEARRNGAAVARTVTRADGRYRLALRPGRYTLRLSGAYRSATARILVRAGGWTRLDFSLDTGIR